MFPVSGNEMLENSFGDFLYLCQQIPLNTKISSKLINIFGEYIVPLVIAIYKLLNCSVSELFNRPTSVFLNSVLWFSLATASVIFKALEERFWEMSHLGDSGINLRNKEVSKGASL